MIKNILKTDKNISKELFILSLPIILSNVSRVIMDLTDMVMINRLGQIDLFNGVSMGGIFVWVPMSLAIGVRIATQTISARRYGEKKYYECGFSLRHGLLIGLTMGVLFSILGYFLSDSIVPLIVSQKEHIIPTIEYAKYLSIGILPFYLSVIFQGFYTSIEKTKIHMKIVIAANILNVYLNAGLIYGSTLINHLNDTNLGFLSYLWFWVDFKGLEVKGSAIATVIATTFMLLHYVYYLFKDDINKKYNIFISAIKYDKIKTHFSLAFPLFVSEFFLSTSFLMFYLIMESIGKTEFAAWGLILRIMHASFMPAMGVGQGCATMVGKYLGEKNTHNATQSISAGLKLAIGIMGSIGLIFILFPYTVIDFFNTLTEASPLAASGLRFVGIFQIFDAICIVLFFAMSAGGDIKYPVYVEITMHWLVMVPMSWFFAQEYGFWGALAVFGIQIIITAIIFIFRIKTGKWKEIEV